MVLKILFVILTCTALINGNIDFLNKIRAWGAHGDNVDFAEFPRSNELISQSNANEFEDDLNSYIEAQQITNDQAAGRIQRTGCAVFIKSLDYNHPIYVSDGKLKTPSGNSGILQFNVGEKLIVTCVGISNYLKVGVSPQKTASGVLTCKNGNVFTGSEGLSGQITLESVKCQEYNYAEEIHVDFCARNSLEIGIGYNAGGSYHYIMKNCFNPEKAEVLYVTSALSPENAKYQDYHREEFYQSEWFPSILIVKDFYKKDTQMITFTSILGNKKAKTYLPNDNFLTRGHLAPSADFIFSSARSSTLTYINCAPQWKMFNEGNWNTLEKNLRKRISEMGYTTQIYTGTWGILKLRDESEILKEIYLNSKENIIPVPLWFYKVVYEPSTQKGIVFLGLNNPHLKLNDARQLVFCKNVIDNDRFIWLMTLENMKDIKKGYMMGCEINDFRRTVDYLPKFTVNGLLF